MLAINLLAVSLWAKWTAWVFSASFRGGGNRKAALWNLECERFEALGKKEDEFCLLCIVSSAEFLAIYLPEAFEFDQWATHNTQYYLLEKTLLSLKSKLCSFYWTRKELNHPSGCWNFASRYIFLLLRSQENLLSTRLKFWKLPAAQLSQYLF